MENSISKGVPNRLKATTLSPSGKIFEISVAYGNIPAPPKAVPPKISIRWGYVEETNSSEVAFGDYVASVIFQSSI